ncbi:MAG: hypothetical protein K2Q25_14705 [Mycobacteriaceae bacterium]|nr:hypothetical protein [Mycobacteriaceae bacterium]
MSGSSDQPAVPNVDLLAQSMLLVHGAHQDASARQQRSEHSPARYQANAYPQDPERAAALRDATRQDRERYLKAGLQSIDCRFCHVRVAVKKLGPAHTAVQWNAQATQHCAYFSEIRASGGDSARVKTCPKLADSIDHAVAEGFL